MALSYSQGLFLDLLKQYAFDICAEYDVPPQVCVAQAIVETNWGWQRDRVRESRSLAEILMRRGFNIFSLTGKGSEGYQYWRARRFVGAPAEEEIYTAKFARFSSFSDAVHKYCQTISKKQFCLGQKHGDMDLGRFVTQIWGLGYASHPDYVEAVLGIMDTICHDTEAFKFKVMTDPGLQESLAFLKALPAGPIRCKGTKQEMLHCFRKGQSLQKQPVTPVVTVEKFVRVLDIHPTKAQIAVAWAEGLWPSRAML